MSRPFTVTPKSVADLLINIGLLAGLDGEHPLYTGTELKYLENISIEKEVNRIYAPLTNHNRQKYAVGKIYRTQRKIGASISIA